MSHIQWLRNDGLEGRQWTNTKTPSDGAKMYISHKLVITPQHPHEPLNVCLTLGLLDSNLENVWRIREVSKGWVEITTHPLNKQKCTQRQKLSQHSDSKRSQVHWTYEYKNTRNLPVNHTLKHYIGYWKLTSSTSKRIKTPINPRTIS